MRRAGEVTLRLVGDGHPNKLPLSASLHAAATLERRYGFPKLAAALSDGNLTIIRDVIETSSDCSDFLALLDGVPLIEVILNVLEPLQDHVLALAGIDPDADHDTEPSGETMSYADYHSRLYQIGTGWLGWSPETTWRATAEEITDAYQGHIEMLRAVYGGKDDDGTHAETDKPETAKFDRAGFKKLRAMAKVQ